MSDSVDFWGQCSHQQIADAMRQARVYVQHSMQAGDGDSEGTPLAILEASASGLPVVSTRHAGIPDVVIEGHTGYLVEEGDVDGMAAGMIRLARSADMASKLGIAARKQIREHFSVETSMEGLWNIVESVI
jgi:glycosyltransferase involved in cell wall biosynthesis